MRSFQSLRSMSSIALNRRISTKPGPRNQNGAIFPLGIGKAKCACTNTSSVSDHGEERPRIGKIRRSSFADCGVSRPLGLWDVVANHPFSIDSWSLTSDRRFVTYSTVFLGFGRRRKVRRFAVVRTVIVVVSHPLALYEVRIMYEVLRTR
jgi:hypothetical protein